MSGSTSWWKKVMRIILTILTMVTIIVEGTRLVGKPSSLLKLVRIGGGVHCKQH